MRTCLRCDDQEGILMIRVGRRRARSGRSAAWAAAAVLCLPIIAACGTAGASGDGTAAPTTTFTPPPFEPLPQCTSAQQSAATGSVRVGSVISSQTVHVTTGERVDIAEEFTPIRPGSTGVGKLSVRIGPQVICRSGNVEGRFTGLGGKPGERLPLIITRSGHAEIQVIEQYVEGGDPISGIVYIDATPKQAAARG
jgi:hypothetical protein